MAATRIIEEERGTLTGVPRSRHQGYYAGDFGSPTPGGSSWSTRYAGLSETTRASSGWS